jgi:hypothetical protein
MHKEGFIINCNTLLHVSTLLGDFQAELFVVVTLRLHITGGVECAGDCVLCTGGVNSPRARLAGTAWSSRLQNQRSTQSTAHSHPTVMCNLSVMTKGSA